MKYFSLGKKLLLLGSFVLLGVLLNGGVAKAAPCYWVATVDDSLYSSSTLWKLADGSDCNFATVSGMLFRGASSTKSVVFDVNTTTPNMSFDDAYSGEAYIAAGITVTSTGSITFTGTGSNGFNILAGSTLNVASNLGVSSTFVIASTGVLNLGGNLTVSGTLSAALGTATVNFTSTTATTQTISGPGSITFGTLNVNGSSVTLGSSVTTTGDLTVASGKTLALAGNSLVAAGNITNTGGTITQTGGVVTMTGASKTLGGVGGTTNLKDLVVSSTLISLAGNVTTTGALTLNSASSVLALGTKNLVVSSSFAGLGTVTQTSGSVTMIGEGNLGGTSLTMGISDLIITGTTTLAGTVTASTTAVSGVLNGGSAKTLSISGSGTPLSITGTFNPETSNVNFTNTSVNIPTSTYYSLTYQPATAGTATLIGNVTSTNLYNSQPVDGTLNFGSRDVFVSSTFQNYGIITQSGGNTTLNGANIALNPGTVTTTLNNLIISSNATSSGTGTLTVNNLTIDTSKELMLTNGLIIDITGTGTPFVANGTLAGTSTIKYSGATAYIASSTYYNLTINSASSTLLDATTINNALTINTGKKLDTGGFAFDVTGNATNSGNLIINGGETDITGDFTATGDVNIIAEGALIVSATSTLSSTTLNGGTFLTDNLYISDGGHVIDNSTGTIAIADTGVLNVGTGANFTAYNLSFGVSGDTVTTTGNVTTTNVLTIGTGNTLNAGSGVYTFTATSTPFVKNGTFNANTSEFVYAGGTGTTTIASTTYYKLTIGANNAVFSNSATTTYELKVNTGKSLNLSTYNLVVQRYITNLGTITQSAGSVTMIDSAYTTTIGDPTGNTTFYDLNINDSTSLYGDVTTTHVLTLNAGLTVDGALSNADVNLTGTGIPLVVNTGGELVAGAKSTIIYSGATANIASTTYYNLKINGSQSMVGNVTTTKVLTIGAAGTLNAGIYNLVLSGDGTPLVNSGTFTASTSEVKYTNTGTVTTTGATYNKLTLGTGTYNLGANATTTGAFVNGGTFVLGDYYLVASSTYANNNTVTGISHVKKLSTGGLDNTTYVSGTGNGTGNNVILTITDPTANASSSVKDTISVTLVAASSLSDSETITLTEEDVSSGVFTKTIPFYVINAKTDNNGLIDVSGVGNLTLSYTNGYGALVDVETAEFTGPGYVGGGSPSGGAGSAPSVSSAATAATISTDGTATTQTITLNFSVTNATQVAISEDPGFVGASWDTYSASKQFTLSSGAGAKTIYVKFRSDSGGITSVYTLKTNLVAGYTPATKVVAPPVVTAPAVSASAESVAVVSVIVPVFEVANPDSAVVIPAIKKLTYKPGEAVKFKYTYKNTTSATQKIKVVRQLLDENGKVLATSNGSATLNKGKLFTSAPSQTLGAKLANGTYTLVVKVLDSKNNVLDQNSFQVVVAKPLPPPAIIANYPDSKVVITGLKLDYKVGNTVKYAYSYKNETGKSLKVKITRQLVGADEKVVSQSTGTRTLTKGQNFKFNVSDVLSKKLAGGVYTIKIKVFDSKNVMLDENSFDVTVNK